MKAQILQQLKKDSGIVSGATLSSRLGITRVAIWKHIQKLIESGYQIESGPKGYRLIASPDTPFAWEFPGRESQFHYFSEVSSTMDIARDMARKGCPDFTIVVADKQASGRGRMDRNWESPPGGLYFTMILRPQISLVLSPLLNFLASLVLSRTIRERFHVQADVKWPNDILVDDRKISGMLSEMEAEGDLVSFINIGIGININNTPSPDLPSAASIKSITGQTHNRRKFLADYLARVEDRLHQQNFDSVIAEWKAHSSTLGKQVRVVTRTGVTRGKAVDVDEGGALIVKTADGSFKKVIYGDCFHQA